MYDYVLQYGFDKKLQEYIQNIKEYLKINNVEDKERNWLPHITLCTNNDIDENIYNLANKKFYPISVEIKYIWVYDQKMKLVKEYRLK